MLKAMKAMKANSPLFFFIFEKRFCIKIRSPFSQNTAESQKFAHPCQLSEEVVTVFNFGGTVTIYRCCGIRHNTAVFVVFAISI